MAQLDDLDAILAQEFERIDQRTEDVAPPESQKLSYFTVSCLVLNRTIGSGIFATPHNVLLGTKSVGISLILWAVGGLVSICGLTVWNEFGLTVPLRVVPGGDEKSVPRSGGEKNYLEYLLQRPKFLATCMYGVAFLLLGNLSGNAVAFGNYILVAAGHPDAPRSWNIAIAIAALTIACAIHIFSRRGGIILSNFFAVMKVSLLLAIVVIGFAAAGGAHFAQGKSYISNLSVQNSFSQHQGGVSTYTYSFFYILYSYSGFEQPFYVLSEVKHPRKVFPVATTYTLLGVTVLFVLVNIAYVSAVDLTSDLLESSHDIATVFFATIFGDEIAPRVMAGLIAFAIYGNMIVQTFTASRVKQELAKEGILPWSLFFAKGQTTPDAWLRGKLRGKRALPRAHTPGSMQEQDIAPEQTPMPALLLHWVLSVVVLAATASLTATTAYFALVFLYSYVLIALIGFLVASGLVYLHLSPSADWHGPNNTHGFRPWGGPAAAIVYATVSLFMLVTAFLQPVEGSPFAYDKTSIQWYILPAIGLSSLLWGVVWWLGLKGYMRVRDLQLIVTRVPHIEQESGGGEWVQRSEVIVRAWMSRAYISGLDKQERSGRDSDSRTGAPHLHDV